MPRKRKKIVRGRIHELLVKYARFLENVCGVSTSRRAETAIQNFLDTFPKLMNPEDVFRGDAEDYKIRRAREIRASTVNYELYTLQAFWEWMVDMELVGVNPWKKVRKCEIINERLPIYSRAQMENILAACLRPREELFVRLTMTYLLSSTALVNLHWSDIDFISGCIVLKTGEGEKSFPLRRDTLAILTELRQAPEAKIFSGTTQALEANWRRICIRANVPVVGFYGFRKSGAKMLYQAGIQVGTIQLLLGKESALDYIQFTDLQSFADKLEFLP